MSDESIIGGLRQAVEEVKTGQRPRRDASDWWRGESLTDVDPLVISLEAAAKDSTFSEVIDEQRLRDGLTEVIKGALIHQIEVSFLTRTDHFGNAWAPLKRPPSQATGAMQRGAIESVRQGFYVTGVGFRTADGLQVPYWRFQDQGTISIPARPFWGVGEEAIDHLTSVIIDKAVNRTVDRISDEIEREFGVRFD